MAAVTTERLDRVAVVTLDRPDVRNAVDGPTAARLAEAFRDLDADDQVDVVVFHGEHGTFCSGADLKAISSGEGVNDLTAPDPEGGRLQPGPMGPSRFTLSKPVIAAIEGHAVAGGLELALWCDLRVVAADAILGVFCRRWGVPLIDGGTVRLPRLIGHSRAMDLILTGRAVDADEALAIGLANRKVAPGTARDEAVELARLIGSFPQTCVREDRLSAIEQWDLDLAGALANEFRHGLASLQADALAGAARFAGGAGRGGAVET